MPNQTTLSPSDANTASEICDDLIVLAPEDNVLVVRRTIKAGSPYWALHFSATARASIDIGYKVARCDLKPGDKILKYGAPIGSATKEIHAGDVVHIDNMKSDYLPTYTHEADNFIDRGANK